MIHQMINRHMIIELDHMSDKSLNDTLDILWEEKYPGICQTMRKRRYRRISEERGRNEYTA